MNAHALKPIAQLGWRRFYSLEELELWAVARARVRTGTEIPQANSCGENHDAQSAFQALVYRFMARQGRAPNSAGTISADEEGSR